MYTGVARSNSERIRTGRGASRPDQARRLPGGLRPLAVSAPPRRERCRPPVAGGAEALRQPD